MGEFFRKWTIEAIAAVAAFIVVTTNMAHDKTNHCKSSTVDANVAQYHVVNTKTASITK